MSGERWSLEQSTAWAEEAGWIVGCNFTPSTASNQLEMWQPETFDLETIDRELGWAAGLGMNAVRVYLHDLLYASDNIGFLNRVDQVLEIADNHKIGMIPVLFDGVWNTHPELGPQPEPTPNLHNSVWVQSPGAAILHDPEQWITLRPYVTKVLERFGQDSRVLAWDLFNEPDQMDRTTIEAGTRDQKIENAAGLLTEVFDWARSIQPSQPLTAGIWEYDSNLVPVMNSVSSIALEQSDIISFHHYGPENDLATIINGLKQYQRPLICTEWLARSEGSTVDNLQIFSDQKVGAINWGLVDGKTQTRFPWRSWWEKVDEDEPWFHELLYADGTSYSEQEANTFRRITTKNFQ